MKHTVQLQAGLGNQMFGYAFCKYLEYKITKKVHFSLLPFLITQDHNGLELHTAFANVKGISINKYHLISFFYRILNSKKIRYFLFRVIRNIKYPQKVCYWAQSPYSFIDVPVPEVKYYCGLWQNFRYVEPIRVQLLHDFTFNLPTDGKYKLYEQAILNNQDTVAVHIRRGDYLQ